MFVILAGGLSLWIAYGFLQADWIIVIANSLSLAMVFGILYFKLRENAAGNSRPISYVVGDDSCANARSPNPERRSVGRAKQERPAPAT
jgi:hypothetical protein